MRIIRYILGIVLVFSIGCTQNNPGNKIAPLSVCPENSNYFVYMGKPVILISSSEHYFALVNQKFNYVPYLEYLQSKGFNVASVMSGVFLEPSGNSHWEDLVIPWQRSAVDGYKYGGKKFDLNKWDENYFDRLEQFVAFAFERDIFVNYIFFAPFFDEHKWHASPLNPTNNVNTEFEKIQCVDVYTLNDHRGLLEIQKELIDRVTHRLKKYPNVIYEVTFDGASVITNYDWHLLVFNYLHDGMDKPKQPIAFNVGGVYDPLNEVPRNASAVSYRFSDAKLFDNIYGKGLPVFMGENTFAPGWEPFARQHAYRTVLSGCGIYTHIDFTYNARYPVGNNAPYPRTLYGGGPEVHLGIEALAKVMNDCDFVKMLPNKSLVNFSNPLFEAAALENHGNEYLAYISAKPASSDYISAKPASIDYKVNYKGFIKPNNEGWHDIKAHTYGTIMFTLDNSLVAQSSTEGHHSHTKRVWYNGKDPIPFELESKFNSLNGEARIFIGDDALYQEVITKERLLCADKKTPGVETTYYTGKKLDEKRVWRIEDKIHHKVVNPSPFVEENQVQKTSFNINLPSGKYHCQWIDAQTASIINEFELDHAGGQHIFRTPVFVFDILLKIKSIEI
jgi:hypothetical protein